VDALTRQNVPYFGRVVERCSQDQITLRVEIQANDLCFMALQTEETGSFLNVPYLGSVVHRTGGGDFTIRIETEANNFLFVTFERIFAFSSNAIPNLRGFIKTTSHN
jgi:hypothetical protein